MIKALRLFKKDGSIEFKSDKGTTTAIVKDLFPDELKTIDSMTTENESRINRKEFAHLVLKSCKKAFREYITNYDVKDLTKIEKNFIRNLILLWNDYTDDWLPILIYQFNHIEECFSIRDERFSLYYLKVTLLSTVFIRYKDLYGRGLMSRKIARQYTKLTHEFCDQFPWTTFSQNDISIIELEFKLHPVMNHSN